jgi:hypothetical protein
MGEQIMASKSASKRRPSASTNPAKRSTPQSNEVDETLEDSLAYEHGFADDEEEEGTGYVTRATEQVRHMTAGREGRVVVGALVGGFAIGAAIGCIIASSRTRQSSWSDRLACEGLGRQLLDRIGNALPDSITEKLHR